MTAITRSAVAFATALTVAVIQALLASQAGAGEKLRVGMQRDAVRDGISRDDVKERLRAHTDDALARGVTGVPTVAVDDQLFWGDDRLEDAAAALST